jgi:hypothetical protein
MVNQDLFTYVKQKPKAKKGEVVVLIKKIDHVLIVEKKTGERISVLESLLTLIPES